MSPKVQQTYRAVEGGCMFPKVSHVEYEGRPEC